MNLEEQYTKKHANLEEEYLKQYAIGFPTLHKLFMLSKKDFITVMKDIFQDNESVMEILENRSRVVKTLVDDKPEDIKLRFYDSIKVTYLGVEFKPEHGPGTMLLKFDKFFNVDVAINAL
jgi:hypothetical protein